MFRRYAILQYFLLALLWPAGAMAQQADVITGRVVDEDGNPVVGARVQVTSVDTEISFTRLTDAQGRYLIYFPDGGGIYILRISQFGMEDYVQPIVRVGSEELLLTNVTMRRQTFVLEELLVEIETGLSQDGAGAQGTSLTQEDLLSLPLENLDPATVALLAAGVIATDPDEDGNISFSVAGMSSDLNQITLDGVSMGEEPFGVPEEGIRRVDVSTSSFDVAQGGFAGGQVRVTTARGNNQQQGSLTYRFDDSSLQLRATPTTNNFTRHNIGGSYSGPIIQNKLFYNVSFQLQRNQNYRYALTGGDSESSQRTGIAEDSIARFFSILEAYGAFPTQGQTGAYTNLTNDIRLQTRLDWTIVQNNFWSHSLSARLNLNLNDQDKARINTFDLMQHGGEMDRNQRQAVLNLTSRIGNAWTNTFDLSYQYNWNDALPYVEMPEAQIRVTSEFEDGTRSSGNLVFGGNRAMPTEAKSTVFRISDEVSIVRPLFGDQVHRIRLGASYETSTNVDRSTQNLFGSFRYASLADFEANRPDRFERTLTERESETGRITGAVFFSDTWRVSQPLEITLGLRWDYSALQERPEYNPAIEALFGRRTDVVASSAAWSPRIGFNLNLPSQGRNRSSITGGIGYYAGRAPTNIYSTAIRQTGLPNAEITLQCIGDAVPVPDWHAYLEDLSNVPDTCADGDVATAPGSSQRAPTVTVVAPNQSAPGSLRFELGHSRTLPLGFSANLNYQYSIGSGLWGYRDINLNPASETIVDGRPFFGDPAEISARTGAVSMVSSRLYPEFAQVYEVTSGLKSTSHQFTARLNGTLPPGIRANITYTLGFARDQGSGSLQAATTAGNPNIPEWGTASNDRRHSVNISLTYAVTGSLELSATTRLQSGTPYTPLINRDINGDGLRNDRAFVFDPYDPSTDPALAEAMMRLLDNVSPGVRECLTSQFGQIAARNSCRNGWTQSLSMRANFRPELPGLGRRLTITADFNNVLTGLDLLLHGRDGMKGWGEGQRADANLLTVRSFDPVANAFVYEVNEAFGQDNRGPNSFRNAFSINLSGRLTIGGGANAARPFATGGGAGGAGGNFGGAAGGQNRGGNQPQNNGVQLPQLIAMLSSGGEATDHTWVVDSLLSNPVRRIVGLADVLGIAADDAAWLTALADSLQIQLDSLREPLSAGIAAIAGPALSSGGNVLGQNAGGAGGALQQQFNNDIRPHLTTARERQTAAVRQVQARLSAEQWAGVPQAIRALTEQGQGVARAGAPNPAATIDRILANPVAAMIDLASIIQLNEQQVASLRALSDSLQVRLNARRDELGQRFDNVPAAEQARIFQQIQPELEAGRQEVREALQAAQAILTAEQWARVPQQIRDPYTETSRPANAGGQQNGQPNGQQNRQNQ
ncbi:MAG TPA: carboxypeptidase regulatory-like domain-containing protein [Longimicrobiales bacterium]|nr:carboxypeptidase regulatory-like domain-containing protein [Longimicrobiales bacterium]